VYYSTHSFFFSPRSIFLICFKLTEALETAVKYEMHPCQLHQHPIPSDRCLRRVDYWMQMVACMTKSAPVLIVGTHADHKACTKELIEAVRFFANYASISLSFIVIRSEDLSGAFAYGDALRTALRQP
jgi:hypothetical protein